MAMFWTAVAAVAATLSALFAAVYTWLTFRLVRGQAEPKNVVYVCTDLDRPTILMIRIANIGRDVASDVRFTSSRPIPSEAWGLAGDDAKPAKTLNDGPLINGIPILGPDDRRDITWGQFGGLMRALGSEPINLAFTYKHGRRTLRGESRLEVASYSGTDASRNPPLLVVEHLEEIAKAVKTIAKEVAREHQESEARLYRWSRLRDQLASDEGESSS